MHSEDFLKRADEILETISCLGTLEDEVLKLFCLVHRCKTSVTKNGEDFLTRSYLIEKVQRIIDGIPIILDCDGARMFCTLKIQKENELQSDR